MIGERLGHYEILEAIGKGGMGEVWRARDTELGREVAIKTLPPEFAQYADRLARFEREAKLLASLNHPNIAAIYGLDEHAGSRFLVLELIGGETLGDRLARGAVPIEESLKVALQIAEALEAAHESGVIHRDLKPANIKITPDGRVKVLDFGLAKTFGGETAGVNLSNSPTLSAEATAAGTILGTPAYMSPEQVRGETAGPQADIWAFGCVLFEMLAGQTPFGRETVTETLARVLERDPNFDALPAATPPLVRRMIRRCLDKDARNRLHHIADARVEITESLSGALDEASDSGPRFHRPWTLAAGTASLVVIAALAGWLMAPRDARDSSRETLRVTAGPAVPAPPLIVNGNRIVSVSRDGTRIAYVSGRDSIWLQTVGQQDAIPIAEGDNPFFSSDGEWVAFRGGVGGSGVAGLMKVSIYGGDPIAVASTAGARYTGGTWHDETIIFATATGLYRVSAEQDTGDATLLLPARSDETYAWPQFMPDGESVLLTVLSGNSVGAAHIALLDLETGNLSDALTLGAVGARYVPESEASSGYLVYATEGGGLAARAFDPETREVLGSPVDIPGVEVRVGGTYQSAAFDTSDTGTLVHIPPNPPRETRLVWVDHQGNEEFLDEVVPGPVTHPRVSPDGGRLALDVGIGTPNRRIWVMDLERQIPTQLSDIGTPVYEDLQPVWSRDGERVYFSSLRSGEFQVWSRSADGSGRDERLVESPDVRIPLWATGDNRLVVMGVAGDIGLVSLANPSEVEWLIQTRATNTATVSPDGNWIAYSSNRTGDRPEIYVQRLPGGPEVPVSRGGGAKPLWGLEGSGELYYLSLDDAGQPRAMMAVTVETSPEFRVVDERELFATTGYVLLGAALRHYDISPRDGRFLIRKMQEDANAGQMTIGLTLNWIEELKELVPLP